MSLRVEQDVLWLQISIDDAMLVEVLQCQYNLSRIKSRPVLTKSYLVTKVVEKLSSVEEVAHEI